MKLILLKVLICCSSLTAFGQQESFKSVIAKANQGDANAQNEAGYSFDKPPRIDRPCSQSVADRNNLIDEAQRDQFTVRRLEFLGNMHTRDTALRKRMTLLNEGEIFTRQKLLTSLRRVSAVKGIYPVGIKNVEVRLERSDRIVDMMICFTERPRR